MAEEAAHGGGSGFNIHPMDQFLVEPLFGGDEVHWYTPTNATLWMALIVVAVSLLMVVGARGRALVPSRAQSVAEVTYGFVHKMVDGRRRQGGGEVLPLHPDDLPVHPVRQPAGADPDQLLGDLAHRGDRGAGARGLRHA